MAASLHKTNYTEFQDKNNASKSGGLDTAATDQEKSNGYYLFRLNCVYSQ